MIKCLVYKCLIIGTGHYHFKIINERFNTSHCAFILQTTLYLFFFLSQYILIVITLANKH
jgi:hypothetical protein